MTTPPLGEGPQPGLVQLCLFDPGSPTGDLVAPSSYLTAVDHTDTTPTPETRHT